jgi:hypothetical protein
VHNGITDLLAQMVTMSAKRPQRDSALSSVGAQQHCYTQTRNQTDAKRHQHCLGRAIVDYLFRLLISFAHATRHTMGRFLSGLAGFVQRVVDGLMCPVEGIVHGMTDPLGGARGLSGGLIDEMFNRFARFASASLNSTNQLLDSAVDMKQIIVRQFGPFGFQLATNGVPFAFKYILGNHRKLLSLEK